MALYTALRKFSLSVFITPIIGFVLFMGCSRPVDSFDREPLGEFRVYGNGLIYDSLTIMKARQMVDSLTRRVETGAPKRFRSLEQGYGTYVYMLADSAEAHEVMTRSSVWRIYWRSSLQPPC
jgi:hypothetical protein